MPDHDDTNVIGAIIFFTPDTIKRCTDILEVRKHCSLKYADSVLPEEVDDMHGYHRSCYQKFIALSKAHRDAISKGAPPDTENVPSSSVNRMTRSNIQTPKPTDRTGIFPEVCIFCSRARKTMYRKELTLVTGHNSQL